MKNINTNWHKQLNENEWNEFLNYSYNDKRCNEIWSLHKQHLITYEDVCEYEQSLFLQLKREKILNYFVK